MLSSTLAPLWLLQQRTPFPPSPSFWLFYGSTYIYKHNLFSFNIYFISSWINEYSDHYILRSAATDRLFMSIRKQDWIYTCRMETLNLRNIAGRAKVVGILVCLSGAAAIAVYKGPQFKLFNLHIHLFDKNIPNQGHAESSKKWIKGVLLMLSSNFLWGMWLVLQVFIWILVLLIFIYLATSFNNNLVQHAILL